MILNSPLAVNKFVSDYPAYDVDVKLCAFSAKEMSIAQTIVGNIIMH